MSFSGGLSHLAGVVLDSGLKVWGLGARELRVHELRKRIRLFLGVHSQFYVGTLTGWL